MTIDPRRIEVIDDRTAERLRCMTPLQRLEVANIMFIQAREMLVSIIRSQHPDWSELSIGEEVRRRITHGSA